MEWQIDSLEKSLLLRERHLEWAKPAHFFLPRRGHRRRG